MTGFVKIGIIISCVIFFSGIMCFAERNDIPDVSTPELSKLVKDSNGLFSSTEMQAYKEEKTSESVNNKIKNIPRGWKKTRTARPPEKDTQATGK